MTKPEILSVTYAVTVHKTGGRFSVPIKVQRALDLSDKKQIHLLIKQESGKSVDVPTVIMSGMEIYGSEVDHLKPGERIVVEASKPHKE